MATIFNPTSFDNPVEQIDSRMREYPIDTDPTHFIERRIYKQDVREYGKTSPGASGPIAGTYVVREGWLSLDANLLTYYIEYANKPATRTEPETYSYTFIGFAGGILIEGRKPFTISVDAEVEYKYYVQGVDTVISSVKRQEYTKDGQPTDHLDADTAPTRSAYETMITNGTLIVAEDSSRSLYLGTIVEHRTIRIKAQ